MKKNGFLKGLFCLLVLAGCANTPYYANAPSELQLQPSIKTTGIEPQASATFLKAEELFNQKKYTEAANLYKEIQANFPRGQADMYSTYRLGTLYYYMGQYRSSSREFKEFLVKYPKSDLRNDVLYNFAASEYQQENFERTYSLIERIPRQKAYAMGLERSKMIYELGADAGIKSQSPEKAILAYHQLLGHPDLSTELSRLYLAKIRSLSEQINETTIVDKLASELTHPIAKSTLIAQKQALISRSELASQTDYSTFSRQNEQQSEFISTALKAGTNGERTHIGVVLPLTGRWESYGKRALDSILLAAEVFNENNSSPFKFFIRDSGSNPINAESAVDDLYYKHNVYAIIGSISWKESLAVSQRAQKLGVVNLSLTFKEGLSQRGSYIFQNAVTPKVQLESLVKYCLEQKKFKRFAILAPNDSFGKDLSNHFWNLVEEQGGSIVAQEFYDSQTQDFQSSIKSLVGLDQPEFRKFELQKIDEFLEIQKQEGARNPQAELPPVVDFDALFIPDSPKRVGQIAPALAFFDVRDTPLLGTIEWNSDQLYKRGGKYVEGAIFPSGINLSSQNAEQRKFIDLYLNAYGTAPELLAAQSYEAAKILMNTIRKTGSNDRNDLVMKLLALEEFQTPLGQISFDATRLAQRKLSVNVLGYGGKIIQNK